MSLLPLQSWPPDSTPSSRKLHSDGPRPCLALHFSGLICHLLHSRLLVCGNQLCSLGRPMFVGLWTNPNLRPVLPNCQNLPSHQATHLLTTPLTTSLKIPPPQSCQSTKRAFSHPALPSSSLIPIVLHNILPLHVTSTLRFLDSAPCSILCVFLEHSTPQSSVSAISHRLSSTSTVIRDSSTRLSGAIRNRPRSGVPWESFESRYPSHLCHPSFFCTST